MNEIRYKHIKTTDDVKNSILGVSHKRYIFDLPDNFSYETLVQDTEYDKDICYEVCFKESVTKGIYDILRFPGNAFAGHIGKAIFTNWAKRICEDGAEFVFLLPPKGDALALCLGLMNRLLEPAGYETDEDENGYSHCLITLPRPVGYSFGKLGRLNAEGEILRWTCNADYGIEPVWGTIKSAVISALNGKEIKLMQGQGPIPVPSMLENYLGRVDVDICNPAFLKTLGDETKKFALSHFVDNGKGKKPDGANLPELLRRMESWIRKDDVKSWLRIPSEDMRDVSNAKTSFADESNITMLDMDDKSGWPAAFSIKFGKGWLSVYPNCVDMRSVISPDECSLRGVRHEDEEKSTATSDETLLNAVVTLAEITGGILDSKIMDTSAPAFTLKVSYSHDKVEAIASKVSGAVFLKFLVIWYASMVEDGIAFLPGTLKRFGGKKVELRESGYELAMMKLKGKRKVKPLPCGSLFYDGNPANIQSDDVMDTIRKVLFNVRNIEGTIIPRESSKTDQLIKSRKLVLEAVLGRKVDNRKETLCKIPVKLNKDSHLDFSYEKLNGVRVIIKKSLFNKFSKLTLGNKIRGYEKFNKDKDVFYKKIAMFIQQK